MTKEQTTFINLTTTINHLSLVIDSNQRFSRDHDIEKILINIAAAELGHPIDHCSSCVRDAFIELVEAVTGNKYDPASNEMQAKAMFETKTKTKKNG